MRIRNLTPHPITLVGNTTGEESITLQPSGIIARLSVSREQLSPVEINGGEIVGDEVMPIITTIPVSRSNFGEIVNLPEQEEGVIFVASALVAERSNRADVYSVGELIRDQNGVVIGARGLTSHH
jgi:hypothetical protein